MRSTWSRRAFLKLLLSTLAAGCAAHTDEPGARSVRAPDAGVSALPPATPPPSSLSSSTPTPLPSSDGTAVAFLSAWTSGDYVTMYDLLCQADRNTIPFEAFRERYLKAQTEATVTAIQNELRAVLTQGSSASASFRTVWQTNLFGPLSFDNVLPMVWEEGRWAVDWSSTLVLPALGDDLTLVLLNRSATRGNIYDRNGLGLAVQGKMVEIGVVPGRLPDDPSNVIAQLSVITGVTPQTIRKKIEAARPEWFVSIAHVRPEVSINNDDLLRQLPGVERRESTVRAYTNGSLAAHLVGYLGAIMAEDLPTWRARGYRGDEMVGRSGVEGWGEAILAGKRGGRLVTLTRQNREASLVAEVPPRPGDNIYLSIDKGLQADAENILGQRLGAIVVLDANSGLVLAMASYPRFDPNLFVSGIDAATWAALGNDPNRPFLERGTQGVYPPGSVFKVVTMMAGMEKLGLTRDTTYTCLGTWNKLGSAFVKTCWLKSGHGTINLQDGLTQSCDVVFYEIGLALHNSDPQILPDMARACGLGKPTGITGIQEVTGLVPDRAWKLSERAESWFPGDTVNLAIGQGFLLTTPLQIANLMAAIANGGRIYRPQLVLRIVERSGQERIMQPEVLGSLPVSAQNLVVIREALTNVTRPPRGTAREAFVGAGFTAAGKTGTAESGQEKPHAWFAGYVPAESPQVAIAVVLEHAGEGAKEAAPLFRQMVEAYLARQGATAVR